MSQGACAAEQAEPLQDRQTEIDVGNARRQSRALLPSALAAALVLGAVVALSVGGANLRLWHGAKQLQDPLSPVRALVVLDQSKSTRIHWARHPDKCWAVYGMSAVDGAKLQLVSCDTAEIPHQDMKFIIPQRGEVGPIVWASDTDYCLDSSGGSSLQFWNCSSAPSMNEKWLVNPDGKGHIHWAQHPSRCLDVPDAMVDEGHKLQLWPCREAASSGGAFTMLPEGNSTITWSAHPNKCLVIDKVRNGANVQLWECMLAQSYNRFITPANGDTGPIVFAGDTRYCLDVDNSALTAGALKTKVGKLGIWECTSEREDSQQWIYNMSGRGLIQLVSDPALCLVIPGSDEGQWTGQVQHWQGVSAAIGRCDSPAVFTMPSAEPLRIRWRQHPTKCVSVRAPEFGSHIQMRDCNTSVVKDDEMKFIVPRDGVSGVIAWNARRNLCIEAPGGFLVSLADCKSSQEVDQQWIINLAGDGQIHLATQPTKCLDVPSGNIGMGELQLQDCQTPAELPGGEDHMASTFTVGAIDCKWNEWYMWSACSASCGFGTKRRSRSVDKETFNGGGMGCQGNRTEQEACWNDPCGSEAAQSSQAGGGFWR